MTAAAHVQACRSHQVRAEALETAERFNTSEGYSNAESREEYDVAKQHGTAARAVDPKAPRCP